ncbi:MAG: hypothetical protein LBK94_00645 [Prevotellaceae bacterium]|jgi:hypothetical protein|nr:hypothetical protein [Prevotellaceae bacterium]
MTNTVVSEKEADKAIGFICETREGKYTTEKPDLTLITYARIEIQENDIPNNFNDYGDEIILYGIS